MTDYRLAAGPADYAKAHALVRGEGWEEHELSFPTIMAIKDGELVGILATHIVNNTIMAGPLVIKSDGEKRRLWTMIRLIELYENVMREAGIKQFIFAVPKDLTTYLYQIQEVLKMTPYAEKDGHLFFERNL